MDKKYKKFFLNILKVNPFKTIWFNFKYFPFKTAIRFPVFICWRTLFYSLKGNVLILGPVKTGMIRIGPYSLGTTEPFFNRTIWNVTGTVVFNGKANIGRGCKISVGYNGVLTIGGNLIITGNTEIICQKEIIFGDNCLLSWNILLMDSDSHKVYNESMELINHDLPIRIGNHVWLGCRNTILKGVSIADNCIVCANSTITKSYSEENCVIGGNGKNASIVKRGVYWEL